VALVACVVFSGLWSGLTGMLTLVMHPMLAEMDGPGFALNWIRMIATWTAFAIFRAAPRSLPWGDE
jgi:hypothetical protein